MRQKTLLGLTVACAAFAGATAPPLGAGDFSASLAVMRTHNLANLTQYHAIQFTAATPGVIKTVAIQYQGGASNLPNINKSRMIEVAGLGAGNYVPVSETLARYTITNEVTVLGGTKLMIMVGDVVAREGCYGLLVTTLDSNAVEIDHGLLNVGAICNTAVADEIPVSPFQFGTCLVDPPHISDNSDLYLHMNGLGTPATVNNVDGSKNSSTRCSLGGISGNGHVIAFPPADLDPRLVPKGATAHCSTSPCHLDVKIRNTAPPNGGVDGGARTWTWIAFN